MRPRRLRLTAWPQLRKRGCKPACRHHIRRRINTCRRHSYQGPMINCLCRRRSGHRRRMGHTPQITAEAGRCGAQPAWCQLLKKMASMQSAYDWNARPITVDSINNSNSNFKATAFQVKDSNVKVMENTNNHNQSSHAIKDVIPNQGSYVNKK